MISAMSFIGYFAIRALGAAIGVLATGLFGGMVSSTATTISFAKLAAEKPQQGRVFAAGTILANAVMALRVLVLSIVLSPPLALALAVPLGLAAATALGFVAVLWFSTRHAKITNEEMTVSNPFELSQAVKFALLLTVIQVLERFLSDKFGDAGLYVLAAIAGLADLDAITLSVARDAPSDANLTSAIVAILLAVASSSLVKSIIVARAGGAFARWSIVALIMMVLAAGLGAGLQQIYL
jgi:uncharacterized membrane protein (DUF4010 family)